MNKWLHKLLAAVGIGAAVVASAEENPAPKPAVSDRFAPGQVWRYKTRPGEEASRAIIGKIEAAPKRGTMIHVKLIGLRIKNPFAPGGFSSVISHAPIAAAQVAASVTELTDERGDLAGFSEGYTTWLSSFRSGKAGVFAISLAEIVDCMEQTINQ